MTSRITLGDVPSEPALYNPEETHYESEPIFDSEYNVDDLLNLLDNRDCFRIGNIKGNIIPLIPVCPYTCLHGKQHDSNCQAFLLSKKNNTIRVYLRCHSCNKNDVIHEFQVGDPGEARDNKEDAINKLRREYGTYRQRMISEKNKVYGQEIETEDLSSYEMDWSKPCIAIKSACGTGKTKLMNAYLRSLPKEISILSLTFRRSLAKKQKDDVRDFGFTHYEDGIYFNGKKPLMIINDPLQEDNPAHRLICQIDSLWRVIGHYDLIILDEMEYKLGHIISFIKKKKRDCWNHLRAFIADAHHVVAMDATYSDMSHDFLVSCGKDPWVLINHFNRQADKILHIVAHYTGLIHEIEQGISRRENVVIPVNSKHFSKSLSGYLKKKYAELNMLLINAETVKDNPDILDSDTWDQYQVLIYTPSVTAGISFEKVHFHSCYCYFSNAVGLANSALQQMFRVRNISTGNIYLHIKSSENFRTRLIPVESSKTLEQIKAWFKDKKKIEIQQRMLHHFNDGSITSFEELIQRNCITGNVAEDPAFHLFCQYMLRAQHSQRNFLRELLILLKTTQGCRMGEPLMEKYGEIHEELKEIRKGIKVEDTLKVVQARQVFKDEVEEGSVTEAEFKNYRLNTKFEIPRDKITAKIVHKFDKPELFKYQERLNILSPLRHTTEENIGPVFLQIQRKLHSEIKDDVFSQLDERRTEMSVKFHEILTLIRLFGFSHPFDSRRIPREQVDYESIYEHLDSKETREIHSKFFGRKYKLNPNRQQGGPNGFVAKINGYVRDVIVNYLGLSINRVHSESTELMIKGLDVWMWNSAGKLVANYELFSDVSLPLPPPLTLPNPTH